MKILNLTQHVATPEQVEAGVIEPKDKETVKRLLTFDVLPSQSAIIRRAQDLAEIANAHGITHVMIGGAPFLMSALEDELHKVGISPLYAFSVRQSVEETQTDGSVTKRNVFRHAGFVAAV